MIRIEVDSITVEERRGTGKNGKPYCIREQGAYAHVLDEHGRAGKYPVRCKLNLDEEQAPFAPGDYQIDPRSLMVGDFDRVTVGRLRIVPLKQQQPITK